MGLKEKIRKIAKGNGSMYPSDIVEKLGIPYEDVLNALNELEREGKIAWGQG